MTSGERYSIRACGRAVCLPVRIMKSVQPMPDITEEESMNTSCRYMNPAVTGVGRGSRATLFHIWPRIGLHRRAGFLRYYHQLNGWWRFHCRKSSLVPEGFESPDSWPPNGICRYRATGRCWYDKPHYTNIRYPIYDPPITMTIRWAATAKIRAARSMVRPPGAAHSRVIPALTSGSAARGRVFESAPHARGV